MKTTSLSVLIPAAGSSRRLGQPKQFAIYRGKPLILRAIENAESLAPGEIIVVTGANANNLERAVKTTAAHCVHNPDWAAGMGGSIAMGARAANEHSSGLMILLCDQWAIQTQDLLALTRAWLASTDRIVCAASAGRLGPPVIFPSSCFTALHGLHGDRGAHSILDANPRLIRSVAIENAASDLDTAAQLHRLNGE